MGINKKMIFSTGANLKLIKMILCNNLLFNQYRQSIAAGFTDEQLLSPQLEHWKIIPDTFQIYKKMSPQHEVDPWLYNKFDWEQLKPPSVQWTTPTTLTVYQLSVIVLAILLVIFMAICILSGTYCFYHVLCTICPRRRRKYEKVQSHNPLIGDLIEEGVVNV